LAADFGGFFRKHWAGSQSRFALNRFDKECASVGRDRLAQSLRISKRDDFESGVNGPKPSRYWSSVEKLTIEMVRPWKLLAQTMISACPVECL